MTLPTRRAAIAVAPGRARLIVLALLALAGAAGFATSAGLLRLDVGVMAVRYPVAAGAGYLTFLAGLWVWIACRRRQGSSSGDVPDLTAGGTGGPRASSGSAPDLYGGGRSGGGGGGGRWAGGSDTRGASGSVADLDELWPVLAAAALALCAVLALGYVLYLAPVLLAEVAVDAALVGGTYRRLRRRDLGTWLETALRHTWLPALAVVVSLSVVGWLLQYAAPEADTLGAALRSMLAD